MLLLARLMTGVGLGAALPNLIALTSEAAGPRFRGTAVSLMYCGVPVGAALAAVLGFWGNLRLADGVLGRRRCAAAAGADAAALAA
jgi:MFS family permease